MIHVVAPKDRGSQSPPIRFGLGSYPVLGAVWSWLRGIMHKSIVSTFSNKAVDRFPVAEMLKFSSDDPL